MELQLLEEYFNTKFEIIKFIDKENISDYKELDDLVISKFFTQFTSFISNLYSKRASKYFFDFIDEVYLLPSFWKKYPEIFLFVKLINEGVAKEITKNEEDQDFYSKVIRNFNPSIISRTLNSDDSEDIIAMKEAFIFTLNNLNLDSEKLEEGNLLLAKIFATILCK